MATANDLRCLRAHPVSNPDGQPDKPWQVRFMGTCFGLPNITDARRLRDNAERRKAQYELGELKPTREIENLREWLFFGDPRGLRKEQRRLTLGELVAVYLANRTEEVEEGLIELSNLGDDEYMLGIFEEFCGKDIPADDAFTFDRMKEFGKVLKKRFPSRVSVKNVLGKVRALGRWGYLEKGALKEVPKGILTIQKRNRKRKRGEKLDFVAAKVYTVEQVRTQYEKATPRQRLYLLLSLNCGFTQQDMATLQPRHVDLEAGLIVRCRNKTGVASGFKLWNATITLLRQFGNPDREFYLMTREGQQLVWRKRSKAGKVVKVDSVSDCMERLRKVCGITEKGLTFKNFRKTSASLVRNQYQPAPGQPHTKTNKELYDLFLAHGEPGEEAAYNAGEWSELNQATDWLLTHYAFEKVVVSQDLAAATESHSE